MKRWLINLAGGLAILIAIASIAGWARLGRLHRGFSVSPTEHVQLAAMTFEGKIVLRVASVPWRISPRCQLQRQSLSIGAETPNRSDVGNTLSNGSPTTFHLWEFAGGALRYCEYPYASLSGRAPYWLVETNLYLPYWLITLVSLLTSALWIHLLRRRRIQAARDAEHLCANCGYDLRATPDRCPECGTESATGTIHA